MSVVLLIGRIILGGYFLYAGIHHFTSLEYMAGYAKMKGTPAPKTAVAGSGVLVILGGLSLLLGVLPMIGCILLLIFLAAMSIEGVNPHVRYLLHLPPSRRQRIVMYLT